jgi:hypothetical protein
MPVFIASPLEFIAKNPGDCQIPFPFLRATPIWGQKMKLFLPPKDKIVVNNQQGKICPGEGKLGMKLAFFRGARSAPVKNSAGG